MFKKNNFKTIFTFVLFMAVMLSACAPTQPAATEAPAAATEAPAASQPEASKEPVKIGFMGPMTGPGTADLLLAAKGGELAVAQQNAAGGICGGRPVEIVMEDDKADPKEAANVASKLAGDASILSVAHGWNSSAVLAAAPIFNEAGLPQVDYFGVAPSIREAGPYTFRVIPTGELMAKYLAKWIVSDDGFKKVASFYENTDYGKGLFDVFAAEVKALGGEVVASEAVLMDQKDFSAIIAKFKAAGPDAVMFFGQYEAAAFWAKQAPDIGLDVPFYGSDGIFAPELIVLGGDAVNGVRSVSAYTVDSKIAFVADFVEAFREKFGTDPNNGAGYVYDTFLVMLEALDKGGCTREGAKDYMTTSIKDVQGVTGIITFDEEGDRMFQEGLYIKLIVEDGKFVEYEQ